MTEMEPSFREIFLMRGEARQELQHFLWLVSYWPGEDPREFENRNDATGTTRIAISDRALTKKELALAKKERKWSAPKYIEVPENARVLSIPSQAEEAKRDTRLASWKRAFFELLRKTVQDQPPSKEQLQALFEALNEPIQGFAFNGNVISPYRITGMSIERVAAEVLVRYLNLVARCGPVHGLCQGCQIMFIRGKGKRQFCAECAKKRTSYDGRKEYLKKLRDDVSKKTKRELQKVKEELQKEREERAKDAKRKR